MRNSLASHVREVRDVALFALLWVVFFQLLTALVEATYTFGLLSVDIPPETVSVLFLLTPLLLLLYPKVLKNPYARSFARVTGILMLVCQAAALASPPAAKMIFSGLGSGFALLCLPSLMITLFSPPAERDLKIVLGGGLVFAGLLLIGLQSLAFAGNFAFGIGYRLLLWALLILAANLLMTGTHARESSYRIPQNPPAKFRLGFGRALVLWVGWFSALILLYFAFTVPTVIARWTGGSYLWISILTILSLAVFAASWLGFPSVRALVSRPTLIAWNSLFVTSLAVLLYSHQIFFPTGTAAYPLLEAIPGPLAGVALIIMLLLHPVIYLDFALLAKTLSETPFNPLVTAGGIAFAAFYLMVMVFSQVFTTVYDYIPVVGPLFRDRFWLVITFPAIVLLLSCFGLPAVSPPPAGPNSLSDKPQPHYAAAALILAVLALIPAVRSIPNPALAPDKTGLRVMTYNIQQGYDDQGRQNFLGQVEVIRRENLDIIGLQESDMARIANGNTDIVRYFAHELNMYSYYGPSTVTGTFGIALLSRYPIEQARTFYMTSQGEQTAALHAQITVGEKTFNVLVTHLGNGGPIIQQSQVLDYLVGQDNMIAMGDFNFNPSSEQYQLTTAVLQDAWILSDNKSYQAERNIDHRIDHIFLSPGMRVLNAVYLPEGPSDHPALLVELDW